MTQKTVLVNEYLQELTPHGTPSFPITVSHDDLNCFADQRIRCHWHDDLEIGIVCQGTVTYQIAEHMYTLSAGQAVVINSDVPHSAVPVKNSHVIISTIIIQTVFLADTPGNDIDRNCLGPFFYNTSLPCIPLLPENEVQDQILKDLLQIVSLFDSRSDFFELKIKSLILDCFYLLLLENKSHLKDDSQTCQEHLRRFRIMTDYIHENFSRSFSLTKLADHMLLSRESCCRIFKHMTGMTITGYLTDYRVMRSLQYLSDGKYSIAEISALCGFSSQSRFAKAFRSKMGCNPSQYLHSNFDILQKS